jgi:soluble lytic murein transglycosylase-like protein
MIPRRIQQWWPLIQDAAERHGLDSYLFAAIVDRESLGGMALEPVGAGGCGDNGHGHGLCQIDDRSHAEFIAKLMPDGTPAWANPEENLDYGASYLAALQREFSGEGDAAWACAVAAYNAGPGRVQHALNSITRPTSYEARLEAVDDVTTGGDYVSDVAERRLNFMSKETPKSKPPPPRPRGNT